MTSEKLYSEQLSNTVAEYTMQYTQQLSQLYPAPPMPQDVIQLLSYVKNIQSRIQAISTLKPPPLSFDPTNIIGEYYDKLIASENAKVEGLKAKAEQERESAEELYEAEVADVEAYNKSLQDPIRKKHEELLSYREDLVQIFDHYDITPLDMSIDDNITQEEFGTLVDEALATCLKYKRKEIPLFDRLTSPLKGETNLAFTATYCVIALVLIYFAMPILCIPAFGLLFYKIHNMNKDLEKLQIASALMAQIDYSKFIPDDAYMEAEELDTQYIDDNLEQQLSEIHDYSEDKAEAIEEANNDQEFIAKVCTDARNKVVEQINNAKAELEKIKAECDAKIEEALKDYKPFPTVQSNSLVMSHSYVIGRVEDRIDVKAEIPPYNLVFDASDRDAAIKNMKLYLANVLLGVRVKQLTVEIFDPKNMCGDFTEFFTPETKEYIKPNKMTLQKMIETYRDYSQNNIIALDKRPIDEFNKEAEEKGLAPMEYKLLLFVSDVEKLKETDDKGNIKDELFKEYFRFSASSGVIIWLLDNKKWPSTVWVDNSYKGAGTHINYTPALGKQAVATYVKALANYRDSGIMYGEKYGDVFIPRDKWWSWDTIKGILMPYGLENGDPTRGLNVAPMIGDANVHSLLAGATGAGKSAAINQILISLITMYPPSELQIVYIDFKNVEAAKFTRGYDLVDDRWMTAEEEDSFKKSEAYYLRRSRIPHLRIISGTTDGEYALSVFEFLMQEMERRQKIQNKAGVTKIQTLRENILADYNKQKNGNPKQGTWAEMRADWEWYKPNVYDVYGDLPRLLVIFDEFQVMYNPEFVDPKIIDQINGKITALTKLARAMGAHLWFTSQSMKGTMSKDTMGNFSLRGALRCDASVSEELLGNKASSTIKSKFGYMYSNDSAGTDPGANRFWRVPFLDERDMPGYIDQLYDMLPKFNETHDMAEFYDEKVLVPSSVLDDWYTNYPNIFTKNDTFILGERAAFSTNKAPIAIKLKEDVGENIMVAAFEQQDMLNLTMTMIRNLQNTTEDCTMLINVQDEDSYILLDTEHIVEERFASLASPKQDINEFVQAIQGMINRRLEAGPPYTKVYVVLVQWERAAGIGSDINYRLSDQFGDMMRVAPTVGIHFIMCCREKLDLQRNIAAACKHRVCGMMTQGGGSIYFIDCPKVEKLPTASKSAGLFAIYQYGSTENKFRIYQHAYTRTIESREIVI